MDIEGSEQKITELEIEEFENHQNITLPENFKNFYLKYNGGVLYQDDDLIAQFIGIKYGKFCISDAIRYHQILEENIPRNYLPFATTAVGHIITILINSLDSNFGKIYLFRYDTLEPELFENSLEDLLGVESIDDL